MSYKKNRQEAGPLKTGFNFKSFLKSIRKTYGGPPKTDEEQKETAFHEAGHAYAAYKLNTNAKIGAVGTQSPILHSVFMRSSGPTMGYCEISGKMETREHGVNTLITLMAGSAGEKVLHGFHHKAHGLEEDVEQAEYIIRKLYDDPSKQDIDKVMKWAEQEAYSFLLENETEFRDFAEIVSKEELLSKRKVASILGPRGDHNIALAIP